MLTIRDITFTLEGRRLFDGASATIPAGHKVGVVGRNGTGKTTLFRLIRGEWALDGGEIEVPRQARIGGVAQEAPASDATLLDTVLAADTERAALLAEAESATDPVRIADIHTRLADIESHSAEARAASILTGLGFDAEAQLRPCKDFSGGWRMRVALAAVLFSQPDVLLLDEPTNYLDLEGTVWLETFLARYPHTALVISHDRGLLNRSVGGILHLDQQKLTFYQGNYDQFDRMRRAKLEQQVAAKKKQDAQRAHLQSFVDRFKAKASKAKQAQSRVKMLEKMQPIAGVVESSVAQFSFPAPEELSPPIVNLRDASVGYGGPPVLRRLDLRIDQDDRIALLGANGQGKSTLSKLIAGRLKATDGQMVTSNKLRIGYFAQHQLDELYPDETPLEHIRSLRPEEGEARQRARLAAGGINADIADVEVRRLSGGQKARLAMLLCTIDAPHLLILDEPTNHLDIESREALVMALTEYEGAVILVSHDPHLVEAVADRLWLVRDGAVTPFDGDMDEYRRMLLAERGGKPAKERVEKPKAKPAPRAITAPLKAELARAEERIAKLEEMRDKIDAGLADPRLYERGDTERQAMLHKKRAEVMKGLERAESIWLDISGRLERSA